MVDVGGSMPARRLVGVVGLVCVLLAGLAAVVVVAPSASADIATADRAATRYVDQVGRTPRVVPARSVDGTSGAAEVRTVLDLRFRAVKGERRLVAAQVRAYQPRDTPDSLLMAATSVTCGPSARGVRGGGSTANLLRGRATWLTSSFVYVVPRTGEVHCVVRAYGSRPRPSSRGPAELNRWYAARGSRLVVGAQQPAWAATKATAGRSRLVGRGQATRTVTRFARGPVGPHRTVLVSDLKLTTCAAEGGSRDETTGGRELCAGHVQPVGSRVRLVVRARQGGRGCETRTVATHVVRVAASVHHLTVVDVARLEPWPSRCRGPLTVSSTVQDLAGAAVVVHAPSWRTTLARG